MGRLPRILTLFLAAASFPSAGAAADFLRIENVSWGFDGSVVPNAFNPVSFELYNDGVDPLYLDFRMTRTNGVETVDAPVRITLPGEPLVLAPQSSRRVQMFVYVQNAYGDYALSWGFRPEERIDLLNGNQLKMGQPATVVLYDPYGLSQPGGGGLARFDEAHFPISASGTVGLAGLVFDHEPRWQLAQQQAFLDWLNAGGTVHLLEPNAGERITFSAPLAVLNSPLDDFRVGLGRVIRHPLTLPTLERDYVDQQIIPVSAVQLKPPPEPPPGAATDGTVDYNNYNYQYSPYVDWEIGNQLFNRLKQMTRPDHNWPLIYLMSLVYLAIIFPGCWLIGRRRADYRVTYGAMLASVVLFSMGFKAVGQRGYGEQTALHAVTIAQPLPNGNLIFRQWANLFVTDGDDYRIAHNGSGLLYSSGQSVEAVRGAVVNPPGGEFDVDIPPFSSRTIAGAGVLEQQGFTTAVDEFNTGTYLEKLTVRLEGAYPKTVREAYALYGDQAYTLAVKDGTVSLHSANQPFNSFLRAEQWGEDTYSYGFPVWGDEKSEDQLFSGAIYPLIAESVAVHDEDTRNRVLLAPDRARVFLFADMPEELFPVTEFQGEAGRALPARRAGRVLYVFDVLKPE
jgi:hypothetical protein